MTVGCKLKEKLSPQGWTRLTKGWNSDRKDLITIPIKYDTRHVVTTISWKSDENRLKLKKLRPLYLNKFIDKGL